MMNSVKGCVSNHLISFMPKIINRTIIQIGAPPVRARRAASFAAMACETA